MNSKINFAIIGAQKAGTTTLYDLMRQDPRVYLPTNKEDPFFGDDSRYRRDEWYLNVRYRSAGNAQLLGHAWVNLLFHAGVVAPRMWHHNPHMKLIIMLREPVARAYSAYWYMRSRGFDHAETFEEALKRERSLPQDSGLVTRSNLTYVEHGEYIDQLEVFAAQFGCRNLFIRTMANLRNEPQHVMGDLAQFLGLGTLWPKVRFDKRSNRASEPRSKKLVSIINGNNGMKDVYARVVPDRVRYALRHSLVQKISQMNQRIRPYPEMSATTRNQLLDHYRPFNERLARFLGYAPW